MSLTCYIGFEGSGKSYATKALVDTGAVHISFASPLRDLTYSFLGYTPDDYSKFKLSDCLLVKDTDKTKTGRQVLEDIAFSIRELDKDFFLNIAKQKIEETLKQGKSVVVDDCRYTNELEVVRSLIDVYGGNVFYCCYESSVFNPNNQHQSTDLARFYYLQGFKHLSLIY